MMGAAHPPTPVAVTSVRDVNLRNERRGDHNVAFEWENPEVWAKVEPSRDSKDLAYALEFIFGKHLNWEEDVRDASRVIEAWRKAREQGGK